MRVPFKDVRVGQWFLVAGETGQMYERTADGAVECKVRLHHDNRSTATIAYGSGRKFDANHLVERILAS